MSFRNIHACIVVLLAVAAYPICGTQAQSLSTAKLRAATPWMNTALSPDQRADLLQTQMMRDEELILVRGYFGIDATINPVFPPPPVLG
jgi:hypothetical protein